MVNKLVKYIPNIITFSRIITSVIASFVFVFGDFTTSICLYGYSAISDFFDGYAARRLNAFSEFGRKLDAVSDKIFILSLLAPTVILGNALMMAPFIFETLIAVNNLRRTNNDIRIVTERVGKFKTAMLFPTMILGLLASKFPMFNFLLIPSVCVTTELQYKTYKSYNKQEEERLNETYKELDNTQIISKELSIKDNLINLRNELMSYVYYDDNIEYKCKRKERRK